MDRNRILLLSVNATQPLTEAEKTIKKSKLKACIIYSLREMKVNSYHYEKRRRRNKHKSNLINGQDVDNFANCNDQPCRRSLLSVIIVTSFFHLPDMNEVAVIQRRMYLSIILRYYYKTE